MTRPAIPRSVKRAALTAQGYECACGCGAPVSIGYDTEFDHNPALSRRRRAGRHYIPPANDPRFIGARTTACHRRKTFNPRSLATTIGGDNFEAKKTSRMKRGQRRAKRPLPAGRRSKWKIKLNGNVERRRRA